ncbi:LysM peptidoglycan-binding domain-containing protein [Gillisia sp. M10.2A]|uniref:LysM peptidoglycan-binding domain-containing protein n=1 Tax=Gillisia lutea TaxID=2909668 RepID=A0ABS9EEF7_9FLAO|nr:LysM peptidoglycan-binding domain-containing protein [Gillisia lutea]MCF4101271.1 LysM peptidoglycan-binding domain-containing protein [Gillisia lutea]
MKYLIVICLFFQVLSTAAFGQAFKYHTVAPGENVFRIAQKYSISQEAIFKYNPDAKNGIEVGAKLVIPVEEKMADTNAPVSFQSHKVDRKETLYSLSKEYNVDIEEIKKYNKQLYSKELQKGEIIQIPVFANVDVRVEQPKAPVSSPSRTVVQDKKTREHIILPKETKYGIARKYGMTVKELEDLNPTVNVLQPGIMLRVGTDVLDEPVIITTDAFRFYEVQPQETLFSLTRRFQVEKDSLMALNPALKDGLKSGMILKVPTKDARGRELNDIAEEPIEREEVDVINATLENRLTNFNTKNIVLMLPYNLNSLRKDSISNSKEVLEKDRVMRISLDFYSGAMMAVEKAKKLGISTNLRIFDTQQQASKVAGTINSNNFNDVDAVIGPLLQATSEEAAARLSNLNVPVISPMSNRELRSLPNLYQARPSDDMLRDAMITYLQEHSTGKNVIIIADASSGKIKSMLMDALPQAKIVSPGAHSINEGTLGNSLVKGKENWVILESGSVALLSSVTSALNRMARANQITLFTTDKNNSFESDVLSNEHLGRLKFHFPSEYKEFDESGRDNFIDAYKEKYGYIPNKYTVRGYDLTLDVLLRLGAAGSLEKSVEANFLTEYVENKFLYKMKPNGGFYNDAVYIMQYNNDLTLSVAK